MPGNANALVLIEVTGIFDGTAELQKNWLDLIVNLFHYNCGSDEYGVEAAKYGHKPLYVKTAGGAQRCVLLLCYIVSKLGDFQNLRHYAPRSKEDVETRHLGVPSRSIYQAPH